MNIQLPSLYILAVGLVLLAAACGAAATVQPSLTPAQALPATGKPAAAPTIEPTKTLEPQAPATAVSTPAVGIGAPLPTASATPSPTVTVVAETPTPPAAPVQQADIIDFILPDITVTIGATVRWTNLDSEEHTATPGAEGIYDGSGWDSRTLGLDQSFSHRFQQEGVFAYTCRFHPSMNATVTVVADQSGGAPGGGDYYSE